MYPFQDPSLSLQERVQDLLHRMTIDEKIGLLATHNLPIPRLGIGEWTVGQEIARGLVIRDAEHPSTVFPQPIGMAATFDKQLMYQIGLTAGREARAYYNEHKTSGLMVWGPTVDLSRDPRWGRTEECYGEEPFLTGEMAGSYTLGLRGEEQVWATIPTLKHFCANNHEQDRGIDNANLHPRIRHEFYYEAFRRPVVHGGAHSVMASYNEICHAPADMNHDLKDVLKKEWGLGFVVTDGADFSQNLTSHRTFPSHAQALQACLRAGTDIMTDNEDCVHAAARKALADGLITEADIDCAVGGLLESRMLLGEFDPKTPYDGLTRADVNTPADRALNRRAANEQMILLKNDGTLPLDAGKHRKIGLFGANADCNLRDWYTGCSAYQVSIRQGLAERGTEIVYDPGWDIVRLQASNGCYLRFGEDGNLYADAEEAQAAEFYFCCHDAGLRWVNFREIRSGRFLTLADGNPHLGETEIFGWFTFESLHLDRYGDRCVLSDYLLGSQLMLAGNRIFCREKARPDSSVCFRMHTVSRGTERLAALAHGMDAVIYCGGNDPQQVARECYDRQTLALPPQQADSLRTLADVCKETPLILVLVSGYPYALGSLETLPDAILHTTHAGPELGHAVADTLFGENDPAGRCPLTWYADDQDLADIRDYDIMRTKMTTRWFDGTPLYPFGYGLSYSKFRYDAMHVCLCPEGITVNVKLTNVSDHDGDEVVQVYVHAETDRILRPLRQLCAFGRLHIRAGETVTYTDIVPYELLEIYDVSRERFCLEEGDYTLFAGASSADLPLSQRVHVPGETVPPRDLTVPTRAELWDEQEHTEIYTDSLTGETYVRGMRWYNRITFRRCCLDGMQALEVRASAPVEPAAITVHLDGMPAAEQQLPSCDGFTDFRTVTVPLCADGCHDISLTFPELVCIRDLRIRKA